MMGEGSRTLVRRALADAPGAPADRPAEFERVHGRFLEHYAAVCTVATRPYEGVEALLAGMRAPLAARAADQQAAGDDPGARRAPRVGGAASASVVCGDSLPYRKPDGRTLLDVAAGLGVDPAAVVLVGDTRIDAETANAAGAAFIWVEWGYAADEDRRGLASGLSARSPAVLRARIESIPQ